MKILAEILRGMSFLVCFIGAVGMILVSAHWMLFRGIELVLRAMPFVATFVEIQPHAAALIACFLLMFAGALIFAAADKIWPEGK